MMTNRLFRLPALLVLGSLLLGGCSGLSSESPTPTALPAPAPILLPTAALPARPLDMVKVAHTPSMAFAPLYVAADRGFAKEQGVDIGLVDGGTFDERMTALADGSIDAVA